jgi:Carboxypeptidase regulatory-like domain/TonB dependent receptor
MRRFAFSRFGVVAFLFAFLSMGGINAALAQTDVATGSVAGVVKDDSGGALPGVAVAAIGSETGLRRGATTDRSGRYSLALLPPGLYRMTATLSGFKPVERASIRIVLGETAAIDFTLELTGVSERVVVSGEAPIVETSSAAVAENINERAIKSLPLNGRNFTDLVILTPEAVATSDARVHVGGNRGIMNSFNIDGADSNSSFFGEQRGGTRPPFTFSQEAIQEFQVIASSYNAQYGNAAGGIINAITKSGTNSFHGSGFYYFRNASLIQLQANGTRAGDFDQKQFGATVGGPLVQDKLHFFVGFDGQKKSVPTLRSFIDPCAGNGAGSADCVAFSNPANQTKLKAFGEDLNADYGNVIQTNDEIVPLFKLTWQASGSHLVTLRDNFSDEQGDNLTSTFTTDARSVNGLEKNRFNSIVGSVSSIFSSALSNELILQYAKEDRPRAPNSTILPETVIGSNFQANFGQNNFLPNFLTEKRYQFIDNVSYYMGNHTLRAGVDVSKVDYDDGFYRYGTGQYNFASWSDFFANRPSQFQQSFSAANGVVAYTTSFYNAYIQDSWKPIPNLTIDGGIRYEFQDNPNSQDKNPLFPGVQTIPDDKNNWAPRVGFAWDPANDHKSVVRGGFGIFYTNTPSLLIANALLTNGVRVVKYDVFPIKTNPYTANPNMPTYPTILANPGQLAATKPSLIVIDSSFENPQTYRGSIGYERQVLPDFSVGVDGVLSYTKNLERQGDANLVAVGTTPDGRPLYSTSKRPNTNFGAIQTFFSDGVAHYEAAILSFRKRFNNRWQMMGSYTWSEAKDTNSNERNVSFGSSSPEDFFNARNDYGFADFDVRHRLVLSSTWELPWGFTLSGIYQYRTGFPYSALAGFDANGDGTSSTDRANTGFDANGNPSGAHFDRNTFRQPSFQNLDLALQKRFGLFGGVEASLIVQCFNVAHSSNRTTSFTNYYVRSGGKITAISSTFGQLTLIPFSDSPGGARQFQLGARLSF